jgi:DNA-binding HxlR family transcriptional regulator
VVAACDLGEISPKVLSQTVKILESHGLVERRDYNEVPPRVDYRLTPLGRSLFDAVGALDRWVVANFWSVADACAKRNGAIGAQPASEGP